MSDVCWTCPSEVTVFDVGCHLMSAAFIRLFYSTIISIADVDNVRCSHHFTVRWGVLLSIKRMIRRQRKTLLSPLDGARPGLCQSTQNTCFAVEGKFTLFSTSKHTFVIIFFEIHKFAFTVFLGFRTCNSVRRL